MKRLLLILIVLGAPLGAADLTESERKAVKAWKRSLYVLAASQVADTASSWGKPELNPILGRGRFGYRGAAIKGGVVGSSIALQAFIVKKAPRRARWLSKINVGVAGVTFSVSIRNFRRGRR